MRVYSFATEALALRMIAAIDIEREANDRAAAAADPTHPRSVALLAAATGSEVLRPPDGSYVARTRKAWARPLETTGGAWVIGASARLVPVEGRTVDVSGNLTTIPLVRDATIVADSTIIGPRGGP